MALRSEQVERNSAFQSEELQRLQHEIEELDARIADVEKAVVVQSNQVSAARAVVAARGGTVSKKEPSLRCTKRAKQRVWQKKDGSLVRYDSNPLETPSIALRPCGLVYTNFHKRYEAPRQSGLAHAVNAEATIIITSTNGISSLCIYEGLKLWLLYWLDRNDGLWRLRVKPPRLKSERVGVFASRSPNRPSAIGLSLCTVRDIRTHEDSSSSALVLTVTGVDILDESPLLALRPYNSQESFPHLSCGWLDGKSMLQPLYYDASDEEIVEGCDDGKVHFSNIVNQGKEHRGDEVTVLLNGRAADRLKFIQERSVVDIDALVRVSLRRAFRKWAEENHGKLQHATSSLPVGSFRIVYSLSLSEKKVVVVDIESGMRKEVCEAEALVDPEAHLHLVFQDWCRAHDNLEV